MATVTGITAARAAAIEAASIVSGTINGNNLILTRQGGGTIDAGNVRGPAGATGAQGPAGAAGSVWVSGTGSPASNAGSVGYWYLNDANGDVYEKTGASTWTLRDNLTGPAGSGGSGGSSTLETNFPVTLGVALSDETSVITTGVKGKIRSPFAFTLNEVRINVGTAETSAIMTVNILNGAGTTIFTTKVTIDANEKTSLAAAIPAVLLITAIAADEELTFSVDVTGTVGRGLKCWLIGTRAVTVTSAPSAIITIAAQPFTTRVDLSWTAPTNGGSAITDYIVEYKLNSSGTWLTFSDGAIATTGASVTGLTNASLYDFRVSAVNAIGTSIPSPVISSTPATEPGSPTGLTGASGTNAVALTWTAPASNGGSPFTDYKIEFKLSSGSTWSEIFDGTNTNTNYTLTGLTSSTSYDFRVSCRNAVGYGAVSSTYTISTLAGATVPGIPTTLAGTAFSTSMTLTWVAPASDGGSALTDYIVEYKLNSSGTWLTFADGTSTSTGATVTGLASSTSYDFRVSAVNAIGAGSVSTTLTISTGSAATVPGAPTALSSSTVTQNTVNLTWTAPASNGGATINDYKVEYKLTSSGTWLTFTDSVTATTGASVTGLTNSSNYDFRVSATNSIGYGAVSSTYTVSTTSGATVPNQLTGVTGTAYSAAVAITNFTLSGNGGASVTDFIYEYKLNSSGTWLVWTEGTNTSIGTIISGLAAGSSYDFRVSAVNSVGTSTPSSTYTVSTLAAGTTPTLRGFAYLDKGDYSNTTVTFSPASTTTGSGGFTTVPNGGDIVYIITKDFNNSKSSGYAIPTGFTQVALAGVGGNGALGSYGIYKKVAGGSAGSPTTDTAYQLTGTNFAGSYWAFAVAGSSDVDFGSMAGNGNSTSPAINPSFITRSHNTLIISLAVFNTAMTSISQSFGTQLREVLSLANTAMGVPISYEIAHTTQTTGGASGTKSWTFAPTTAVTHDTMTIAIKP